MTAFCPEHPKWEFTPLSETKSIPTPFICGVPPPPGSKLQLHGLPTAVHMRPQYKKTTPAAIQSVIEIRSRFFSQSEKEWGLGLKSLPGIPRTPSQYWPRSRAFSYTCHFPREKALGSRLPIYRTQKRFLIHKASVVWVQIDWVTFF